MTRRGAARCSLAACLALAGCDTLFGIGHVDESAPHDASIDAQLDAALPPCTRGYPSVPLVEIPVGAFRSTSGDFNKDGKRDLAIASSATSTLEILLGNGDGTFAPRRSYSARTTPMAIATADFDGNGALDIVVANDGGATAAGQLSILMGNGDGTFAAPTNTNPTGTQPRALAVADFDKDGKLDIAVSNFTSNNVGVFLGNGNGTFNAQVAHAVGTNPFGLVVADFNEDTKPDIATANFGAGNISVILNTSTGAGNNAFGTATNTTTAAGAYELATADLDNNNHADLAITNQTAATASILLGNGNGTFQPITNYDVGVAARSIAIMDVDHDSHLDVLVGDSGIVTSTVTVDGQLSMLHGAGNGLFDTQVSIPTLSAPIWMTIDDFDNDTKPDLAVLSRERGFIHVLLDATGKLPTPLRLPTAQSPVRGAVADLDHDGRTDLAIASSASNVIDMFLSAGGVLTQHTTYPAGPNPNAAAFATIDTDEDPDLVIANYSAGTSGSVWVRHGMGSGTFNASTASTIQTANGPTRAIPVDLDQDGDLDVLITNYNDHTIQILRNANGALTKEAAIGMGVMYPLDVAAHDFNNDGRPDLVTIGQTTNNLVVRLATGPTTYGPALSQGSLMLNPFSFAIADLDKNGTPEVVLADHGSDVLAVLSSTGDGAFGAVGTFPTTEQPWGIALSDFDGDGILDAITTSDARDVLTIAHGLGDGRFGALTSYPVGLTPAALLLGDFDGDGYPDAAVADRIGNSITILQARCLK